MYGSIPQQEGRKRVDGERASCLKCSGTRWTYYAQEMPDGTIDISEQLCPECKLIIPEKKKETREERGIALAIKHFDEIVKIKPWTWSVPSASGGDDHEVNLKHASCNCPDSVYRPQEGPCMHYHALRHLLSISGQCSGCRKRFVWRELIEVTEDHDSLTWFPGDLLCPDCSRTTGVA